MIYAATGHRPDKLGGYSDLILARLVRIARDFLEPAPPVQVISGMAQGWDTAVAMAALDLGVPLIAAIPFRHQAAVWPEIPQRRFYSILNRAAEVHVVCEGGYSAEKMQRRNEWMVDRAGLIVAMWDGSSGGTCNCVEYADAKGVPVVNLYPLFKG
jgi:uncharacterized phage-like protein YoqJ